MEEKETNLTNDKLKDSSAKLIFGDRILCAQFLRDYVGIPILKNVEPEDIEDVTTRYIHMFTNERDSDVVKKVHIKNNETPFFLISLIEHKSHVDYNVVMQVFRYMAFIWEDYEKEMEKKQKGCTKLESFKYPPIIPIVFYDGGDNWTAATKLHERIFLSDVFREFIPDCRCILMQLKDYSNEALMEKKNELSVLMLIDRLKDEADFKEITESVSKEYLSDVTDTTPEYLRVIMAQIMSILLEKINVPQKEAEDFMEKVRKRKMGELLANFKGWDVQAIRREAREEARKEARKEAGEIVMKAREEDINKAIKMLKAVSAVKDMAKRQLMIHYNLDEAEADKKMSLYW